jgi:hypothetical protein
VADIWRGNGVGQYLPSDDIPRLQQAAPNVAQGQYAVKILLNDPDQSKFPIGAGLRRDLYGRRTRRLGGAAKNLHPRAFVVQLALPAQCLMVQVDVRTSGTSQLEV